MKRVILFTSFFILLLPLSKFIENVRIYSILNGTEKHTLEIERIEKKRRYRKKESQFYVIFRDKEYRVRMEGSGLNIENSNPGNKIDVFYDDKKDRLYHSKYHVLMEILFSSIVFIIFLTCALIYYFKYFKPSTLNIKKHD